VKWNGFNHFTEKRGFPNSSSFEKKAFANIFIYDSILDTMAGIFYLSFYLLISKFCGEKIIYHAVYCPVLKV